MELHSRILSRVVTVKQQIDRSVHGQDLVTVQGDSTYRKSGCGFRPATLADNHDVRSNSHLPLCDFVFLILSSTRDVAEHYQRHSCHLQIQFAVNNSQR